MSKKATEQPKTAGVSIELVDIGKLKTNEDNPRFIKTHKFRKLVKSITDFPDMMYKRPIIAIRENGKILGGNMRYRACQELEWGQVPVIYADNWTPEQMEEFIVKDNIGFGDWDFDILANQYDQEKLIDWGFLEEELARPVQDPTIEPEEEPIYPIVPQFSEKYDYVIIMAENEIDLAYLENFFQLETQKSYKNQKVAVGRVVDFEKFRKIAEAYKK